MAGNIIRRPWSQQPQSALQPDLSNPLARGLTFVFSGAHPSRDLLGALVTPVNAPGLIATAAGMGPALNGSNQAIDTGRKFTSANGTILLLSNATTSTGVSAVIAGQSGDDAGNNLGLGWQGGSFIVSGVNASIGTLTGDLRLAGTWGTRGIRAFVNGALTSSNVSTTAPTAAASAFNFNLGCFHYNGGRIFFHQSTPALFAVWNRALSDADVATVSANPWQLFSQPRRLLVNTTTAGTNITPGVGALTLTGFAPTVAQTANQSITPGVGALTLTGFAPTILQNTNVVPGVGALTLTGFAPTLAQTANQSVTPGVGALTLTGYAPTVAQGGNQSIAPGVGALSLTGYAPTVTQGGNQAVTPGVGSLSLVGYAPAVAQSVNQFVTPGVGALTLTGFAPSVAQSVNQFVVPGTGALTLTGFAPSVAQTANQAIVPGVGALTLTGYAPAVTQASASQNITPDPGVLTLTGYAPDVTQTGVDQRQISYPGKKKRKVYPQPKKRPVEEEETLVEAVAEAIPDTSAQTQELIASVLALEASNERTQTAALQTLTELNARQIAVLKQAIAEAEDEEEVIELLLMA